MFWLQDILGSSLTMLLNLSNIRKRRKLKKWARQDTYTLIFKQNKPMKVLHFAALFYLVNLSVLHLHISAFRETFAKISSKIKFCNSSGSTDFYCTGQKIKLSFKDFFSKCDQIRRFPRIWSHLLKKTSMENFIFCAVLMIRALFLQ